jgi:hypothetical protein
MAVTQGCASAQVAKDARDARRRLAERDGQLRESLERQHETQNELRRAQEELARTQHELARLRERLGRLMTVEEELAAVNAQYVRDKAAHDRSVQRLHNLENTPKAVLLEKLDGCQKSIPIHESAAYNEAVGHMFRSLQIIVEPLVAKGLLSDDHYIQIRVQFAGRTLWNESYQTTMAQSPLLQGIELFADLSAVSALLRRSATASVVR